MTSVDHEAACRRIAEEIGRLNPPQYLSPEESDAKIEAWRAARRDDDGNG